MDVDGLLADLARWTADTRTDAAARARTRERWLRQAAEEDARFAGLALDLSEARAGVAVRLTGGRTLHGHIAAVATDFCVLRHGDGAATLVAFAAIATLRPDPGFRAGRAASERGAPVEATLADVLLGLAADRPRVRLVVDGGGEAVVGELRSVGTDVATIRLDGEQGGTVYVQMGAVREVTLLG